MALSLREKAFMHEYIINKGNAYQAALKAGYTEKTARKAAEWLNPENQKKPDAGVAYKPELADAISEELDKLEAETVADELEVMEYLTSVMRKTSVATAIVYERAADGQTSAREMEKLPTETEALRAAEILTRIYRPKITQYGVIQTPVVIRGYDDIDD